MTGSSFLDAMLIGAFVAVYLAAVIAQLLLSRCVAAECRACAAARDAARAMERAR